MRAQSPSRPPVLRTIAVLAVLLAACGGCSGRFFARTKYVAPGFSRSSLRGRAVAVVQAESPADQRADVKAYPACDSELRGILAGISEEGARVRVLLTADAGDGDSAYLLLVGFTESTVYRAYALPRDRGDAGRAAAATRTSGRRVGVWLKLLRPRDRATVWLAEGFGEMWETRTAAAPGASPAAPNVDDDLGSGNLPLYPDPPPADVVSQRLTRRLLAHLPIDVEPEPN